MFRYVHYYGRFQDVKGSVTGLPAWARWILTLVALPGIALVLLSILAFVVSLAALLVLTVPVYRLLRAVTAPRLPREQTVPEAGFLSPGRRRVDVTIIE